MSEQSGTDRAAEEEQRAMRRHDREARDRDATDRSPNGDAISAAGRPAPPGNVPNGR
jgi:hypothetical protein